MKKFIILIAILLNSFICNCQIYLECCPLSPYEYTIGDGKVYMPNIFSPNQDGMNDYFQPFVNIRVNSIENFIIRNPVSNAILWQNNFINDFSSGPYGWDGLLQDSTIYNGSFTYSLIVNSNSTSPLIISGTGCAILCSQEGIQLLQNIHCHFPDQANEDGTKNPIMETGEKYCDPIN